MLAALFGGKPDPTREWPPAAGPAPEFDLATGKLGALAFEAPLEDARFLGKPDEAKWQPGGILQLTWARRGLQLEFVDGHFTYAAWFIGPDAFAPQHRDLKFARPRPAGGPELSGSTTEAELLAWLGDPDRRLPDDEETVLEWSKGEVLLEFELTPANLLKRWSVYPV